MEVSSMVAICQFGQTHLPIWTNAFANLDECICQFGQIHLPIWTNTFVHLDKYIEHHDHSLCEQLTLIDNGANTSQNLKLILSKNLMLAMAGFGSNQDVILCVGKGIAFDSRN